MEDTNGGASAVNLLQHAIRAVEAGDARNVVLLAGDLLDRDSFSRLASTFNRATIDHLAELPIGGPNALFAMLTQRHMRANGLTREDYGHLVLAQRRWAALNESAVYRTPLTMADYLGAPVVAEPLRRFDCAPVVSGADGLVISSTMKDGIAVLAVNGLHNFDGQEGDGLTTGLGEVASELWETAGLGPDDMDAWYVYDDYPAMILIQLADLGLIDDAARFIRQRVAGARLALNTSGGQLSAGQAGAAGGMHGLVEATTQLLGQAGARQVSARTAVVTGYGMVLYRYGACANAAVLTRS